MVGIRGIVTLTGPVTDVTARLPGKGYSRLIDLRGLWPQSAGAPEMTRREHEELQRKLTRARRLALEPTDTLSQERAAQMIEDLEYQLFAGRITARAIEAGY